MSVASKTKTSSKKNIEKVVAKSSVLQEAKPTFNPLSSFCYFPESLSFDVQHTNERILLLLRQHFIVNVGWIVTAIFLGCLPSLEPFASMQSDVVPI